jgi:cytochrome c oxidase cbb3-type subunit 3
VAVTERDPYTGKLTTGHDWNGIKELDTPVPRVVLVFLAVTVVFAIAWTTLMPAWPYITSYTRGLLNTDQRTEVAEAVAEGVAERAAWTARIESEDFAAIQADPALMRVVREAGATLFGDNCAACHGLDARGGPGFPNLAEAPTLWGDDPDTIAETIRVGINSTHPETRFAQMLAFGRDQMLDRASIQAVVAYVRGLSDPAVSDTTGTGAQIFADNCAGCHGDDATGIPGSGAPNLADGYWIYGGDQDTVYHTVFNGRQGHMPQWEHRLSPVDIKLLTLYVLDRRGAST